MEAQGFQPQEQRAAKQFADMKVLQEKQIAAASGDKNAVKEVTASRDKNFKIKETDKDYVHVAAVTRHLDSDNKKFVEEALVIKVHANQFQQMIDNNAFATYDDVKVIHDPRPNAPEEYTLKPLQPGQAPLVDPAAAKAQDAALAAREQKAKDAEKRAQAKIDELNKLLEQAEKASSKKQSAADKKAADLPPAPDGSGEVK